MSDGITRIPEHRCPYCSHQLSAIAELKPQGAPNPGDVTVCINCAGLLVLNDNLQARRPTMDELGQIANSEDWPEIARTVRSVKAFALARKGATN